MEVRENTKERVWWKRENLKKIKARKGSLSAKIFVRNLLRKILQKLKKIKENPKKKSMSIFKPKLTKLWTKNLNRKSNWLTFLMKKLSVILIS